MHAGNIMDDLDFTEEEIQEQLQLLGYKNIAKDRVSGFKRDLDELIRHGDLKNLLSQMGPDKSPPASSSPNPPAFTKEKVGPCYFEDCGQRFFLHTADVAYDKRVRPVCRDGDSGQPQGRASDSYARYSVAPKFPPPPGLPQRLQLEADASETLQSSSNQADNSVLDETLRLPATDGYTPSPDSQTRRCIKRKVLRKHKGQSLVCDESIYTEDSDAASCLEERLEELRLSPRPQDRLVRSWSAGSETEDTLPDAFESYVRGRVGGAPGSWSPSCASSLQPGLRPKPKSCKSAPSSSRPVQTSRNQFSFPVPVIRPAVNPKALKKTDPVAKYFQYKRLWDVFKLPGEADRAALRLEIKERLAYQPPPPRPPRVYVPNTYTVPTEKKRSALRWEVRSRLASGLVPWKFPF